jgi:ABC-type transport system involved in cytochrome bd biosynthesis fused ATPase/permease subunit
MKERQIPYRHQLKNKLSDQASVHDDAIHGLKKQYADRIEEAEAKFRQYQTAVAHIEDLKDYVQDLEREKSASTLAKAAVEKELQGLTS